MESLYLDISDYLPEEEVEAVEEVLRERIDEDYILFPSAMNEPRRRCGRKKKKSEAHARS
jgi:hypothetical protein